MIRQLGHVLRTYYRRPINWVIIVAILFIGYGLVELPGPSSQLRVIEPHLVFAEGAVDSGATPGSVLNVPLTDSDALTPRLVTFADNEAIVALNLSGDDVSQLTPNDAKRLSELRGLQWLRLNVNEIPKGTLSTVSPTLQALEIRSSLLAEHAAECESLSGVTFLRVDQRDLTPTVVAAIANIPYLETLVITPGILDLSNSSRIEVSNRRTLATSIVEPLKGHKHLSHIYGNWDPQAISAESTLSGVRLMLSTAIPDTEMLIIMPIIFQFFIILLVALQLWAHFALPRSMVLPGFFLPHFVVAAVLLIGGSIIAVGALATRGMALAPTIAFTCYYPAIALFAFIGSGEARPGWNLKNIAWLLLLFIALFPLIAAPYILVSDTRFPYVAAEFNLFMRGGHPLVSGLWIALDALLIVLGVRKLRTLAVEVSEGSPLPVGLSPWDPRQQQRQLVAAEKTWWHRLSKVGAKAEYQYPHNGWQWIKLWRTGNPSDTTRNAIMSVLIVFATFIAPTLLVVSAAVPNGASLFGWSVNDFFPLLYGLFWYSGPFGIMLPIVDWNRRLRSLSVESLRPVTREQFASQLFQGLLVDILYGLIPATVIGLVILVMRQMGILGDNFMSIDLAFLIAVGGCVLLWGYAMGSLIFAIRRPWVQLAAMVLIGFVFIGLGSTLVTIFKFNPGSPWTTMWHVLTALISAGILIPIVIIICSYICARQREWG